MGARQNGRRGRGRRGGGTLLPIYLLLALLLPIGLALLVQHDLSRSTPLYERAGRAVVTGLAGLLLASLLFVAVVAQITGLFGGEDGGQVAERLYPAIGWWRFTAVAGTCLVATLALPPLGHRRSVERR